MLLRRLSRPSQPWPLRRRSLAAVARLATYDAKEDTIAAVVTGAQKAAVGVVRISGEEALSLCRRLFRPRAKNWTPRSHRVYYGDAVDDEGRVLDEVLCLVFRSPRSYTAEDVVELHCHGGRIPLQRVLAASLKAGARLARPGEFTLRAFLNGRLDLTQVCDPMPADSLHDWPQAESVGELIDAKTAAAADSALAGLKGGIGDVIASLRERCLDILTELEARLDFDEEMPELDVCSLKQSVAEMEETVESCLKTASRGRLLRQGLQVAIVGRPNVGKSSLMNAWCKMDKAIVTEIPGTTRDVVEADLSVHGVPVTLLDTAGIRKGSDVVEQMGIERAAAAARGADVIVMVVDIQEGWTRGDGEVFQSLWSNGTRITAPSILVANKTDLASHITQLPLPLLASETFAAVVRTSALKQEGLEQLDRALLEVVELGEDRAWAVNARQSEALFRCHEALERLSQSLQSDLPLDLWTIDLREALIALGEVSGDEIQEEILDNVFRRFCIGK